MSERTAMTAVQQQLAPMCELLERWTSAANAQGEENGNLPAADSIAMAELAIERRWSAPNWDEPVRNAHTYGRLLVASLLDHAAAMAAVARSAIVGPSFAHLTLMRSMMETTTLACWLLEAPIGAERRVKRSLAYRLHSANNMGRMKGYQPAVDDAAHARARARAVLAHHGWIEGSLSVGDERIPPADVEFSRRAFGRAISDRFDTVLWNYSSAATHGTFYALSQQFVEVPDAAPSSPLDPLGTTRAVVVSAERIFVVTSVAWHAARAAVVEQERLMGWSRSPDHATADSQLQEMISSTMKAMPKG